MLATEERIFGYVKADVLQYLTQSGIEEAIERRSSVPFG